MLCQHTPACLQSLSHTPTRTHARTHTNMETSSPRGNFHNLQKQAFLSTAAALACKRGIFLQWNAERVRTHECLSASVWLPLYCSLYVLSTTCKCAAYTCGYWVFSAHTCGFEHLGVGRRRHDLHACSTSKIFHQGFNPDMIYTFHIAAWNLNFRAKLYIP